MIPSFVGVLKEDDTSLVAYCCAILFSKLIECLKRIERTRARVDCYQYCGGILSTNWNIAISPDLITRPLLIYLAAHRGKSGGE